jgi:FKBP-type peptidyl-prolyl cis-trans isomerase (trigger factor)
MKTQIEKLPAKTYKITITIPVDTVNKAFDKALETLNSKVKMDGFRTGKAPANLVENKVDKEKLNGSVVNTLIPDAVSGAIKEYHLNPITSPKTILKQLEKDKECVIEATIIEYPEIVLGDYKNAISLAQKQQSNTTNNSDATNIPQKGAEITKSLLETTTIEISQHLVEEEVSNSFMRLIDQTAKLGLTIDEYLRSVNKSLDKLKEEFKLKAEENLKLEFILNEIAKKENISVTEEDIKSAINASPDEKTRDELSKEENKWYIKSILLKNKVLSWISDLCKIN